MGRRRDSVGLCCALIATFFAAGCAAPVYFGRPHVAADLQRRTGHLLGPEQPPRDAVFPDTVNWEDGLSEDEAATLGLWNNPGYQELLADLHVTCADLIQARQLTNPELSTLFPVGAKQWELSLTVPLDVVLLRPRRVAAAQLESRRVAERLVQDGLNVVRDLRWAYVDLVLAQQRLGLAEEGAQLRNQIAQIAEARLQAGAVAELDVSAMRLDALFSEADVARTGRDVDLARQRLRFLMGVASTDTEVQTTPPADVPPVQLDLEELVSEAVASRPDLRALRFALVAACERARLARCDYLNVGAVLPNLKSKGKRGFEAGPGLRLAVPIFHQNQGAIARADAEVERLRRQQAKLRDTVALEVRQAYTQLLQAQEDLCIWRERVVPQADQAVASARKALEEDGVSLLLVLETSRQLLSARERELLAASNVRRAVAELERSVGRCLLAGPAVGDRDAAANGPASHEGGDAALPPEPDPGVQGIVP